MRPRLAAAAVAVVFAWTAAAAQRPASSFPDAIFINGKVIVVEPASRIAQAFAVSAGRFAAVGTNDEVRGLAGPRTRIVDLRGRGVVPASSTTTIISITLRC